MALTVAAERRRVRLDVVATAVSVAVVVPVVIVPIVVAVTAAIVAGRAAVVTGGAALTRTPLGARRRALGARVALGAANPVPPAVSGAGLRGGVFRERREHQRGDEEEEPALHRRSRLVRSKN